MKLCESLLEYMSELFKKRLCFSVWFIIIKIVQ